MHVSSLFSTFVPQRYRRDLAKNACGTRYQHMINGATHTQMAMMGDDFFTPPTRRCISIQKVGFLRGHPIISKQAPSEDPSDPKTSVQTNSSLPPKPSPLTPPGPTFPFLQLAHRCALASSSLSSRTTRTQQWRQSLRLCFKPAFFLVLFCSQDYTHTTVASEPAAIL